MPVKVLLVRHMPSERADRVSRHFALRGCQLDWRCPAEGDPLPGPDEGHRVAVVYGGAQSVNDAEQHAYLRAELDWIQRWLADGGAYLGLCLGGQLLARALGAIVARHPRGLHEIGYVQVHATAAGESLLPKSLHVYQWHKEGFELPAGAELLATGTDFPNQAFRVAERAFGLQFHPEVTDDMMRQWMEEAGHMLDEPGAHPRERQLADGERFGRAMGEWLASFLDAHLLSDED